MKCVQSLSLQLVEENGEVSWRCGRAPTPVALENVEEAAPDSAESTALPNKYLPSACRDTAPAAGSQ